MSNSPTYQKTHATTAVAAVDLEARRFISYDGNYATAAGGGKDCQGVSENAAATDEAVSVITGYTALVECSEAIALYDYVMPAADGTGRAAKGTTGATPNFCGRALSAATAAGQMVECQILPHVHP